MVDMGLDKIVHNDREPFHARIFNAWIEDWDSDILITQDQQNEQHLMQKYNSIRFFDDEDNQTYMIAPEKLEFEGPTRRNKQYCVVGRPLDWRYGDNLDLLISIEINDYSMVLIKGVQQDPDLGVKIVHPSIDGDSEATDSDKQENNDENAPKTPYDDENMTASSDDEGNNDENSPKTSYDDEIINYSSGDEVNNNENASNTPYDDENINSYSNNEENNYEVDPDPPTNDLNINDNYDDEENDYEVTPDTPTNGGNNETVDNDEERNNEEDMKSNDKETEETEVNEEDEEDE